MSELTGQPFERYEDYQSMDTFKDIGMRKLKALVDSYPDLINFVPRLLQTTVKSMEEILHAVIKSHLDSLLFQSLKRYEDSPHREELLVEVEAALNQIQRLQNAWNVRQEIGFEDITQVGRFEERFKATQEDVHALSNAYKLQGVIEEDALYRDMRKLVRLAYNIDPKIQFSKAAAEFNALRRDRSIRVLKEASLVKPLMVTDDKQIQTLRVSDEWVEPDPPRSELQPHTAVGYEVLPSRKAPARHVEVSTSPRPMTPQVQPAVPQLREKSLELFTRGVGGSEASRRPFSPRATDSPVKPLSPPPPPAPLPPLSARARTPSSQRGSARGEERKWGMESGSDFSTTSRMSRSRGKSPLKVRNTGFTRYLVQPKERTNEVVVTDVSTKEFRVLETSVTFGKLFALAQLTNAVFIAGGSNASSLAYLVRHDGETSLRAPMSHGRSCLTLAALDQGIYACGGYKYDVLRICERYDLKLNRWTALPRLNDPRYQHSSCAFQNRWIYVFCGDRCDTVERLDTLQLSRRQDLETTEMASTGALRATGHLSAYRAPLESADTASGREGHGCYWQRMLLLGQPGEWKSRSFHVSVDCGGEIAVFGPRRLDGLCFVLRPSEETEECVLRFVSVFEAELPETSGFRRAVCVREKSVLLFDYDYQLKGVVLRRVK